MRVGSRSNLVSKAVQEEILHQTLIEVQSRIKRVQRDKFALRPRNYAVPSYRPIQVAQEGRVENRGAP